MSTLISEISFEQGHLPDCAVAIASWSTDPEIVGFHGSGTLARRGETIYLITARHCLGFLDSPLADVAAKLVIPYKIWKNRPARSQDMLQCTELITTQIQASKEGMAEDLDIAVLLVRPQSSRMLKHLKARAIKLPPTGSFFRALWEKNGTEFSDIPLLALGYPKAGETYVDYSSRRMVQQRARLHGRMTGVGPYPHSMRLTLAIDSPIVNPDGMSGGPVLMRYRRGGDLKYVFVGMTCWGGQAKISFITVDWLTHVVNLAEGRILPAPEPFF
jgi:hypothetical protein